MTEEEARAWVRARFGVSRETALLAFIDLLLTAQASQNLIAAGSIGSVWNRHIVDSAQLLDHTGAGGLWIDVGTGAGFPGIVIAILRDEPILLVEPRRGRAEFLQNVVERLGLTHAVVATQKVEGVRIAGPATIISARAVASLPALLRAGRHLANQETLWLLPKGRSAWNEVEAIAGVWQGSFHVEHSVTDPDAGIVIARGVAQR